MTAVEQFENVILGSGAAGKLTAWDLVGAGRRTAVIERGLIGGTWGPLRNRVQRPSESRTHS
jgi:choline dehydrogenase-like flavoprotein